MHQVPAMARTPEILMGTRGMGGVTNPVHCAYKQPECWTIFPGLGASNRPIAKSVYLNITSLWLKRDDTGIFKYSLFSRYVDVSKMRLWKYFHRTNSAPAIHA